MKTSELIKKVESLGYTADMDDYEIRVYVDHGGDLAASVLINTPNVIDTNWIAYIELPESERAELFTVLVAYASTPIEQRAEEKVYQLRHKWLGRTGGNYLNFVCDEGRIGLTPIAQAEIYKTKATVSQWEEWTGRTWDQLLQEFDEIEVR